MYGLPRGHRPSYIMSATHSMYSLPATLAAYTYQTLCFADAVRAGETVSACAVGWEWTAVGWTCVCEWMGGGEVVMVLWDWGGRRWGMGGL